MKAKISGKNILLSDIFPIANPKEYKTHFAVYNQKDEPLEVFARDREEWKSWNAYKGQHNDFNRRYIFSLINYGEQDMWLFGGIYEVFGFKKNTYDIKLTEQGDKFIGRLKIQCKLFGRNRRLKLEKCFPSMSVSEILKETYVGQSFTSYENIDITFSDIASAIKNYRKDWQFKLQNAKGVYLISDMKNGKRYVGSAYGKNGIWSRWKCYVETGHGWNDDLLKLIKKKGMVYARKHFKFSLLEHHTMRVADDVIHKRESFWKRALMTRGKYGYNKN